MTVPAKHRFAGFLLAAGLLLTGAARADAPGAARAPQPMSAETALVAGAPDDPLLRELLNRAETDNADLALAAARLEHAQAAREFAAADRRPWLNGGLSMDRQRVPESRLRDSDGNRHRVPAYRSNRLDTHLSAGYEIDLFGRQKLRAASAEAVLAASAAEQAAIRLSVRHEVIAAYADFRLATDLLALAERSSAIQDRIHAAVSGRVAAGIDAPAREREAAHSADSLRQQIAQQISARQDALSRLGQLLGQAVSGLPPALLAADAAYFASDIALPALPPRLPANLLARRPDILAAEQELAASQADAERIRRERYPSLTLTGSLGFVSESLQRWLRGEALAWLVGGAIGGPLLDGGRNEARHAGALAASKAAEAAWRRQVHTALAEVESALAQLAASETQLALRNRQQARLQNALDNSRLAQAGGRHALTSVLAAERQALEHEAELRATRRDHLAAWAASRHVLGE